MKKNELKSLLYLLGLTSTISLTGCNFKDQVEANIIVEETETEEKEECLEGHIDLDKLDVTILKNNIEVIKDSSIKSAIRNKFLNNNVLSDSSRDIPRMNSLIKDTKYLYLFDNDIIEEKITTLTSSTEKTVQRKLTNAEILNLINYREDDIKKNVEFNINYNDINGTHRIEIISSLANYEYINIEDEGIYNNINMQLKTNKNKENYNIAEEYILNTNSANVSEYKALNDVTINLSKNYNLNEDKLLEKNYKCNNFSAVLQLNNGEDMFESSIDEETSDILSQQIASSNKDALSVDKFINDNLKILNDIYGDELETFLQVVKNSDRPYVLSK